jgi:hypothetical protein
VEPAPRPGAPGAGEKAGLLHWELRPPIAQLEAHELRSCSISFDAGPALLQPPDRQKPFFEQGQRYEATAVIRLSPLGSLHRYQLRLSLE